MKKRAFLGAILPNCVVLLAGLGALWWGTDGLRAFTEEGARRLNVAVKRPVVPAMTLEDMYGQRVELVGATEASRKLTIVEFIYTTCPTICQTAGTDYAQLRDEIALAGVGDHVRLISVSFDPLRDKPEQMRLYGENHGADGHLWTVARPKAEALAELKKTFGLRVIRDGWGGYQHNAALHFVDRKGRLVEIRDTDDVAGAFRAIMDRL